MLWASDARLDRRGSDHFEFIPPTADRPKRGHQVFQKLISAGVGALSDRVTVFHSP